MIQLTMIQFTMIRKASAVAVVAGLVLTASAAASDTPQPLGKARYSFHKVTDGFLRLDTQTGEVALCGSQPVGWAPSSSRSPGPGYCFRLNGQGRFSVGWGGRAGGGGTG